MSDFASSDFEAKYQVLSPKPQFLNSKIAWLLPILALVLLSGCNGCGQSPVKPIGKSLAADEVWQRMLTAYKEAKTYQDKGRVSVKYRLAGKQEEPRPAPLAVVLERPNRLSVNAYQLEVVCDGKQLYIFPQVSDLNGQVVQRPAPAELNLDSLLADEDLKRGLSAGDCGRPVQLELLLSPQPLEPYLKSSKRMLADDSFDGRDCYRLEVKTDEGAFVFWVDREDFALRRLEYPITEVTKEIASRHGRDPADVSDVQLSADFFEARLGGRIDDKAFTFYPPQGVKFVKSLQRRPAPLPSALFGQRPAKFQFAGLDGQSVTQDDLAEKIAVLMWFDESEPSRAALARLDKVRTELAAEPRLAFYAVSAAGQKTSNEQLSQLAQRWSLGVPVVRDTEEFGHTSFAIGVSPTLVVLDGEGRVQIFEPGANPDLDKQLPVALKRLLKGDDLAAELLQQTEAESAAYRQHLERGGSSPGSTTDIVIPDTKIEPWQDPRLLVLTKLWTCDEIKLPGNLLVVEQPDVPPRIFVNDGLHNVVELDGDGKVATRHELPPQATATCLRTARDGAGKRYFAACLSGGQQLFLFDDQWKLLLAYPPAPEDQPHDGIRDVQLCDLDSDGKLEICIGFWGSVGVQAIDLAGNKLWSNRLPAPVLTLVQTPATDVGYPKLLATGQRGGIVRLNQVGAHDPELIVRERAIHHLFGARFPEREFAPYLGLSYVAEGKVQAVALVETFDEQQQRKRFEEQWSYPLPEGVFRNPIEYVASGQLLVEAGKKGGEWLLAAVNGAVYLISDDGELVDFFYSGESLSGIAATRIAGAGVLLLSSDKGVTAWKVSKKDDR